MSHEVVLTQDGEYEGSIEFDTHAEAMAFYDGAVFGAMSGSGFQVWLEGYRPAPGDENHDQILKTLERHFEG